MPATVAKIVEFMRRQPVRRNGRGNVIHDAFLPDERYIVDFAPDFKPEGWIQFDTDQDAHYFGVWVNPSKLMTLTYAEGDWTLVVCMTAGNYNAEVQDACEFYGVAPAFTGIDVENHVVTEFYQDRKECFA